MITNKSIHNYPQLVFIVGSGRSGTTLLRNKHHPQVGVTPELRFFDSIMASKRKYKNLSSRGVKEKIIQLIFDKVSKSNDPLWKSVNLKSANLDEHIMNCKSWKEMFFVLAKFTSSRENPKILVEKTPLNIFFLEQILDFFPQAKIIHIFRDGREFCASAKKRNWSDRNINLIALWKESIRAFNKIQKKYPLKEKSLLEIKYENLVENPKKVLSKIFSFLDIGCLSNNFLESLANLPSFSSFFDVSQTGLYKSKHFHEYFSPSQQKEIESLLYSELKKKGYPVIFNKAPISLRIKCSLEVFKIRIQFWFRKKGYFWLYCRFVKNPFSKVLKFN